MTKWIRTEDEGPNDWQKVLVVYDNEVHLAHFCIGNEKIPPFYVLCSPLEDKEIIHNISYWMPLPELPKSEAKS